MSSPIFPIGRPESGDDSRFTFGLIFDVLEVLAEHGYPDACSSVEDNIEMQQVLFRFIYGPPSTPDTPPPDAPSLPWRIHDTSGPKTTWVGLTPTQADGTACVVCGRNYRRSTKPHVPVGYALATGSQVFACAGECVAVTQAPPDPDGGER